MQVRALKAGGPEGGRAGAGAVQAWCCALRACCTAAQRHPSPALGQPALLMLPDRHSSPACEADERLPCLPCPCMITPLTPKHCTLPPQPPSYLPRSFSELLMLGIAALSADPASFPLLVYASFGAVLAANVLFRSWARRAQPQVDTAIANAAAV